MHSSLLCTGTLFLLIQLALVNEIHPLMMCQSGEGEILDAFE